MAKNNKVKSNVNGGSKPRLDVITEIAVRNLLPESEVKEAYKICKSRVYNNAVKEIKENGTKINYPELRETTFRLTEKFLYVQRIRKIAKLEKLEKIAEFSRVNKLTCSHVKNIYTKFNSRLHDSINHGKKVNYYNPILEEEAFKLTKKYFGIQAHNKLSLK